MQVSAALLKPLPRVLAGVKDTLLMTSGEASPAHEGYSLTAVARASRMLTRMCLM